MGVFHPDLVGIQVRALQRLGAEHALVVYGRDGMDEISLGAATMVGELRDGEIREYELHPEDFGFAMSSNRAPAGGDARAVEGDAARRAGQPGGRAARHRDAQRRRGAVRRQRGRSIAAGVERARGALESGAAKAKLAEAGRGDCRRS